LNFCFNSNNPSLAVEAVEQENAEVGVQGEAVDGEKGGVDPSEVDCEAAMRKEDELDEFGGSKEVRDEELVSDVDDVSGGKETGGKCGSENEDCESVSSVDGVVK